MHTNRTLIHLATHNKLLMAGFVILYLLSSTILVYALDPFVIYGMNSFAEWTIYYAMLGSIIPFCFLSYSYFRTAQPARTKTQSLKFASPFFVLAVIIQLAITQTLSLVLSLLDFI